MAAYAFSTASGSSTSGTYSTTYKSSRGSVVSSGPDLASQLSRMDVSSGLDGDEEKLKIERAKRLVMMVFCHGDGDIGALVDRWLSELGVGWVLDLADDASAGTSLLPRAQRNLTENWIRALNEITRYTGAFVLGPVQLFKEIILTMLRFVDAVLAAGNLDATNGAQASSVEKLRTLLDLRDAVFSALEAIQLSSESWDSSVEMEAQWRIGEVLSLLLAKEQRLIEAVSNTMAEIRSSILNNNDDDDEWGIQTRQGSPDICKLTRSLVNYIKSLWIDCWRLNYIVCTAAELCNYVLEQDQTGFLTTLAVEIVSSLHVKLAKRSESFPDHSLRFLFLINNTHFIWQHLHQMFPKDLHMAVLAPDIDGYIRKYLQVSWEPVLSCLYNHTPRWFRKNSPLPKFELEFQKTYTAQKHWKVPDPMLRTRLRKAIVEKVVSGFTKYLEDNNVTNPGVTPQEREKMLLELFEG
ncbi:unnamed protein product [Urochloa decumbens]|uniref:Exocyst subunit Exo70 family protein n=1 Tax=Urochloa decumbens TaxID=240449 RepID=A0ABC9AP75_9POAL